MPLVLASPSTEATSGGSGSVDVETRQSQDLQHRARRSGDHELEAVHAGAIVLGDREPQARRIDEVEAGEVEDDALAARLEPTEHIGQLGSGGKVELAREADDRRAAGMLDRDVEPGSVVVAHRRVHRWTLIAWYLTREASRRLIERRAPFVPYRDARPA